MGVIDGKPEYVSDACDYPCSRQLRSLDNTLGRIVAPRL